MSSTASKSVAILSFRASSRQRQDLVHGFARYGSVILGFSAFVLWNGGVVLGRCLYWISLLNWSGACRWQIQSHCYHPSTANAVYLAICRIFLLPTDVSTNHAMFALEASNISPGLVQQNKEPCIPLHYNNVFRCNVCYSNTLQHHCPPIHTRG